HYRKERSKDITKRGAAPTVKTVNNEIELLRRAAKRAARRRIKLIPLDPFVGMERSDVYLPVENIRRNVVEDNPHAALTIAEYLKGADLFERALVLIAHSSGMRRNEIARMEMSWIDRTPDAEGRPLRIVDIPPGIAKGKRGKRRGRQTWISVEALAALDAYRASWPAILRRRCPWAFANTIQLKDGSPGKHFGHHLHKDYLSQRFRELDDRVGVTGPSGPTWLHDLRRSFITLARRRGESTSNIRQASGHLTEAAFERYDIHSRGDAIVVRDRIEAARARELAALEQQRKAPHRAPASSVADIATREIGQHGVSKHLTL
ncbi:MAG TPA: site-specific integrase, partial [Polyangia bacterium]|nr:site-specific integrase [Polyangia bacterium]